MARTRTILVVEDDSAIRTGMVDALSFHGFKSLEARTGPQGLDMALSADCDLVLLDLVLPKRDGLSILKEVRAARPGLPVIILTAKGDEDDRVAGLRLGADDYVVKPFRRAELIARVNAFLRRRKNHQSEPVTRFGDCTLDLTAHKLFRNGVEVELTAKEFALLVYFASREGCALTRDDILDAVWGSSVAVTRRSIDRCVATLRSKIERDPHNPTYVHTIRDIGYRFDPDDLGGSQ